ncbi:MAG: bacillithiol biosynthesis cysteine-adding enzyme BshC [Flavobacterium sp.]|nr:bacillithiol biosynthesis cysteine-adding enzyme BshC [Flavobacterium sp.]
MNTIKFRDLPTVGGFSDLFNDYISDFQKVQNFYELDFHSPENFKLKCETVQQEFQNREGICNILLNQNRDFGCGENTFVNISRLQEENTFAIVTGQQVGIVGGPLYTLYKIFTLLKLKDQLNDNYPEMKFVPVFWLESEDHDFEEVNYVNIVNNENQIKPIYYPRPPKSEYHASVGDISFDISVAAFIQEVSSALPNSEFKENIIGLLNQAYSPGVTFEKAFVQWINLLLPDSGIIFISPNDRNIKKLLSGIFQKEIVEYPLTSQLVIQKSAELEKNYHAQVKPRALNLFLFYKDGRFLIEPRENDFSLKGTRKFFTKDELMSIATETPELLSPNVVLRPICQDRILPTVAYVAGPSEIAYFAQLKPVYKNFGLTMPIIYPRASATILEDKVARILEKYELNIENIYEGYENTSERVMNFVSEVKIDELFNESNQRVTDLLSEMKFGLGYIDQTLLGALENTQLKIEAALQVLKEKTHASQKHKHEVALKQVEKVFNNVFPNGNFQERELNIINYLNKYGLDFHKWLMSELQFEKFEHQIIEIK